ncbi:hypothetical protein DBR06_SOUSAS9810105, partial [Sousa chinensis]
LRTKEAIFTHTANQQLEGQSHQRRATGIGILIAIPGIFLLICCWYCRRCSG